MKDTNSGLVKFAILLCALPCMADNMMISPALMSISESFPELSFAWISMIATISCIFMMLSGVACGFLTARFKKKHLILIGSVLFTVGGVATGFMTNIWGMYAMRAIEGFGAGTVVAVSSMLIPELYEDSKTRDRMMGFYGMFTAFWGIVLTYGVGWIAANFAWQYCFYAYLIGVIMFVVQLIFLPDVPVKTFEGAKTSSRAKLPVKVWALGASAAVFAILTTTFFVYCVTLFDELALGGSDIGGLCMSVETVGSFIGGLLLVQLYKKCKNFLPGFCWIGMGVFFFAMAFAANVPMMFIAAALWGFSYGTFYPYLYARGAKLCTPETNDRTMAMVNIGYFLGYGVSSIWIGIVSAIFQNETAVFNFQFGGIACIVLAVLYIGYAVIERNKAKKTGTEIF